MKLNGSSYIVYMYISLPPFKSYYSHTHECTYTETHDAACAFGRWRCGCFVPVQIARIPGESPIVFKVYLSISLSLSPLLTFLINPQYIQNSRATSCMCECIHIHISANANFAFGDWVETHRCLMILLRAESGLSLESMWVARNEA